MFQEFVDAVNLREKEREDDLKINLPSTVLRQVKLEPRDLANPNKIYQTWWVIFGVNTLWYSRPENRKKLAKLIPCFLVASMPYMPFEEQFFSSPETFQAVKDVFESGLILIPIVGTKRFGRDYYDLMGIKNNNFSTDTRGFHLNNFNVKVLDKCIFGKFYSIPSSHRFMSRLDTHSVDTDKELGNLLDYFYTTEEEAYETI